MLETAAILAGGFGTRLKERSHQLPKCLMTFGDRTFITLQINWLLKQGFKRIFICTGYKHELVENFLREQKGYSHIVELSKEPSPLGTGGAIKFLTDRKKIAGSLLVINGDTFFNFNINRQVALRRLKSYSSIIWVSKVGEEGRFASIDIKGDRVAEYEEKGKSVGKFSSCGCYILKASLLKDFKSKFSLEADFFPFYVKKKQVGCLQVPNDSFYDFGTAKSFDSLNSKIVKWLI